MFFMFSTRLAFVRLIACGFGRANVDIDETIEKFARSALYCSANSATVALPRVSRTEFALLLSGAYSRADFHSQFFGGVGDGDGHCSCSVCRVVPILRC